MIDEIKNEVENYKTLKWYESFRGKSAIILGVIFLLTSWHRFFLALFVLPIIYFVKKGSKSAMVLAGIYSIFLTLVNSAVYIEKNRDAQGDFNSSLLPLGIYLGLCVFTIIFLKKSYKVEKLKHKVGAKDLDKEKNA